MTRLSEEEAYMAMFGFLDEYYKSTRSDEIATILGGLSTLPDGSSADPAYRHEWQRAVRRAQAGEIDTRMLLTKR